jgi:hypothetical protein
MNKHAPISILLVLVTSTALLYGKPARAAGPEDPVMVGIMVSIGGRYDDVRMCVASPAGSKGGLAMDVSFFTEVGIGEGRTITVNIPVMRPLLFAAAFKMLQFEPEVTLKFRKYDGQKVEFWMGPTFGVTLHYGPDYNSERSGPGRGESFFAMGPKFGGTFALTFDRPGEKFDFILALAPYVTTLFSINDAQNHRGVVIGGLLTGQFRFEAGGD